MASFLRRIVLPFVVCPDLTNLLYMAINGTIFEKGMWGGGGFFEKKTFLKASTNF